MTVDGRDPLPRRDDGATFAAERVRPSGSPARVVAVLAVAVLAGLVGLSALGRDGVPEAPVVPEAVAVATALPTERAAVRPTAAPNRAPSVIGEPLVRRLLEIDLRPAGSHLFVHGEIHALSIAAVEVRLLDPEGKVAASRKVRIPGGSTAFRLGAAPRFDVHFPVPDEMLADGLVIEAEAIAGDGEGLAVVRVPVTSPRGAM